MGYKCNKCGIALDEIKYVEPDWTGYYKRNPFTTRPPLCEPCWRKADREAAEKQHNEDIDRVTRS